MTSYFNDSDVFCPLSSSEEQMKDVAERDEFLVPIRIDAEASGVRIKDTFTWNMNGELQQVHCALELV
jgi:hypothetical protein